MLHASRVLPSSPVHQRGATLVVALIVLVLIMMIGIMAITSSDTQYRLAANLQYEDVSMNNAEMALHDAERWLSVPANRDDAAFLVADATRPHLLPMLPETATAAERAARENLPFTMDWDSAMRVVLPGEAANLDVRRYYIEMMSTNSRLRGSSASVGSLAVASCNRVNTYQITARGEAARGANKIVQSYFGVLSC